MGCEQCSASFCLRIFSGFDLFFRRLPLVLGFCHSIVAILTCASVDMPSCVSATFYCVTANFAVILFIGGQAQLRLLV